MDDDAGNRLPSAAFRTAAAACKTHIFLYAKGKWHCQQDSLRCQRPPHDKLPRRKPRAQLRLPFHHVIMSKVKKCHHVRTHRRRS
jgi:hypothetical protein